MDQFSELSNPDLRNKDSLAGGPFLKIERHFNSSLEQLWQAWSDADRVKHWWGPESYTCPSVKIDFRVGGQYIYSMKDRYGVVSWSTGLFQKIDPYRKIVCTDHFSDKNGNAINAKDMGMKEAWPEILYINIEFEKISEHKTKITLTHEGIPVAAKKECTDGWNSSLDKLKRLVERN